MTNAAGEGFDTPGILDDCHGSRLHFPEVASRDIIELSLNLDELNEDNDMILFSLVLGLNRTHMPPMHLPEVNLRQRLAGCH